ncbi:MAG: 3-deoxy-8-phosphooctulonate synthase [Phycisphaerales bacterium]|jgi:2-dehydro-3-deoxyphosphooctonate aldolase (KDO 8-P synthase)|nr:3-deoxy-8-phosphooctulonate synthase [Phycisphaerales bacterium]
MKKFTVHNSIEVGNGAPLLLIAGPCVLESIEESLHIASTLQAICAKVGVNFVFKGSFDKANRTSLHSNRGPGLEQGLAILQSVKEQLHVPVTTDVHEPNQAAIVAKTADILQIPAFLCRQTDLLVACAKTNKPINVKKGQFLSPDEMKHVIHKLEESHCNSIMLTERGSFFGYNRLVNDFIGLGDLMELGPPVCFDVTHSTQLPGAGKNETAGRPDRAILLAKAATAAGVPALFLECHPDPAQAASDGSTMQRLDAMEEIIQTCASIAALSTTNRTTVTP